MQTKPQPTSEPSLPLPASARAPRAGRSRRRPGAGTPPGLLATLLLAFLLAPAAGAQEPAVRAAEGDDDATPSSVARESQGGEIFFDRLDVSVVNVDVYVTDKEGRRVTDLTADDFEIYEDGRRMQVTNFYRVEDGRRLDEDGRPEPLPQLAEEGIAEPGVPEPLPYPARADAVPEDQRLHVIVYFDNLFMRPFNRNKVGREVKRFLRQALGPGDRAMVVTFERGLHIRQPFTSDLPSLEEAIDSTGKLSGFGVQAASARREVLQRIQHARTPFDAEGHIDFHAKEIYNDLGLSIDGLRELISSLAGLPGRKALLYVSDGIPMKPAEDLWIFLDERFGNRTAGQLMAARYDARNRFRELTAAANANRVSFYTLDAAGLRSHASLSAEYGAVAGSDGLPMGSLLEADTFRTANRQEPLLVMADDTGGLATLNTNNFSDALARVREDFRTYYSLGYVPSHYGGGRYHRIEVKVKRPGVTVRHRTGYRDKTVEARIADGTLASLLHGVGVNPLGVQLEIEGPRRRDDGYFLVPVAVRIPLGELTLLPQSGTHEARLRVSVAVIDEEGRTSPPEQTELPLSIPDADVETARGQHYVYAMDLLMRPGRHKVSVGVRDELAGETSFIGQSVRVGG